MPMAPRWRFPSPLQQMLWGLALGLLLGWTAPALALRCKPLSDGFILAVTLLMAPLVFTMVASGIAGIGQLRRFGSIGLSMLVYFEAMSLLSLAFGQAAGWLLQPGAGLGLEAALPAAATGTPGYLAALARAVGSSGLLQSLLAALAFGLLLAAGGRRAARLVAGCDWLAGWLLRVMRLLLRAAPLAAFGAMAYAAGRHGLASVGSLAALLAGLYLATVLFVLLAMGGIARLCGLRLGRFIAALRDELVLAAATSSSVAAMPGLMKKLESAGCERSVVAAVVPAGYSFNLNGSNLYLGMAMMFLAQAQQAPLSWTAHLTILAVLMLTSRGASGVAGSAFMVLAASSGALPGASDAGLALLLGIERLLKCRVLANLLGNGVACMALCAWAGRLDRGAMAAAGLARQRHR